GLKQVVIHVKNHSHIQKVPADIDNKVADYERTIKHIKDNQRNRYIAHTSKKKADLFMPANDFQEAISLAVQICDDLHGEKIEYKIGPEWDGLDINLREQF